MRNTQLLESLEKARVEIEKMARDYGLDFYPVVFEMVSYDEMNQFAAYGGFPVRYPHWTFGMQYEQISKGYEYGLSKIYEMVINTDPVYAYLMLGNMEVDQKLVMAHVFGHADFFKHNKWFEPTNRKMMDVMANHATRIRQYIDRLGQEKVEGFIDKCLSLENLIDRYSPYVKRSTFEEREAEKNRVREALSKSNHYMEEYLEDFRPDQAKEQKETLSDKAMQFPERPERDILLFLLNYAPLENWQQDIVSMLRDESYYFAPQGMTKIMNEGWASYWHSKMMTQNILKDEDFICYADHHAGTVAMPPMGFNPYKIGIELFRNIEERWDKGQFGKEWNECEDISAKKNWDKKLGLGRKKIFEVRRDYNDVTFIDEFLTEDFCVENKMFVYKFNKRTNQYEIDTRDFKKVKQQILFQLTNWGQPIMHIVDGNFENRGELLIQHLHEGVDMQPSFMKETMKNLAYLWARPVNVKTVMDNEEIIVKWDGKDFSETKTGTIEAGKKGDLPSGS